MNILKNIFSTIIVMVLIASCSSKDEESEEEYVPQVASAIHNSLYVSISDNKNEPINYNTLLAAGELSVFEKGSKLHSKIEVTDYTGMKMLRFNVALPNTKSMIFDKDRTNGVGTVDLLMKIKETKLPIAVNFIYEVKNFEMFGGNSIYIKSIEYAGKNIIPAERMAQYFIKIKYDGKNTTIEPLTK